MNEKINDQPIFVRVDEYQDVLDILTLVRQRLSKANNLLQSIKRVKQEEDIEITKWTRSLEALDRQVGEVDRLLFKPR